MDDQLLVSFGNYLLSDERKKITSEINQDGVTHADLENWKELERTTIKRRKMNWISVKERLPEEIMDVLVVKHNGLITVMSWHAPFDSGKRIFQWWGFGRWVNQHSQITHWMPLPEPPKV